PGLRRALTSRLKGAATCRPSVPVCAPVAWTHPPPRALTLERAGLAAALPPAPVVTPRAEGLTLAAASLAAPAAARTRRRGPAPLLRKVLGGATEVPAGLARLVEAGMLDHGASSDEFSFHHALVQDVAYARLLRRRRKQLHLIVAQAAEDLYGAGDEAVD